MVQISIMIDGNPIDKTLTMDLESIEELLSNVNTLTKQIEIQGKSNRVHVLRKEETEECLNKLKKLNNDISNYHTTVINKSYDSKKFRNEYSKYNNDFEHLKKEAESLQDVTQKSLYVITRVQNVDNSTQELWKSLINMKHIDQTPLINNIYEMHGKIKEYFMDSNSKIKIDDFIIKESSNTFYAIPTVVTNLVKSVIDGVIKNLEAIRIILNLEPFHCIELKDVSQQKNFEKFDSKKHLCLEEKCSDWVEIIVPGFTATHIQKNHSIISKSLVVNKK